jgi:hypothetical protein
LTFKPWSRCHGSISLRERMLHPLFVISDENLNYWRVMAQFRPPARAGPYPERRFSHNSRANFSVAYVQLWCAIGAKSVQVCAATARCRLFMGS